MKYARGWAVLLALLGFAPAAGAQAILLPSPGATGGFGAGFSRGGRHSHVSAYLSGAAGYAYSPFVYPVYPGGGSRLTVVQVYGPPPLLPGPQPGVAPDDAAPPRPRPEAVELPDAKPLPGQVAGGFRPVRAEDRDRARPPAKPPEKPNDQPPPQPPRPPQPEADPRAEAARQTALGKAAFAAGEYGRAAQRFHQAVQANPQGAPAYFLLAQAEVALGKYDQAVEAIEAGIRLDPNWPAADFRPVALYDGNVADLPEHLRRLEDALARHPDDPVLLFLWAYQLWFDGRQDEARRLFRRAAAVAPDRSFSERFLLARPDKPTL